MKFDIHSKTLSQIDPKVGELAEAVSQDLIAG